MKTGYFFKATRPKTLPASAVPVLIGSAAAYYTMGEINWFYFAITIICSIFIQITTNYVNEIYDFKKGVDTAERLGPQRMVASGFITANEMTIASVVIAVTTFLLGMILVYHAGWVILAAGVTSLLFAWLYTGGPYPLAYNGLGDVFVFIFFGLVAVCGSFYVQTGSINEVVLISVLAPGLISTNILGVNNYRDIETDRKAGKKTLSVKIGESASRKLYAVLAILAYLSPLLTYVVTCNLFSLLPLLTIPLTVKLIKQVDTKTGKSLNETLAGTGKLLLLHGMLTAFTFILMRIA